jgi:low temperature requirement protein LtrA
MTGSPPAPEGKRVTWGELFFDLVFVFAVTRVSLVVHDNHSFRGLVEAFVVFVLVYWIWVGAATQGNEFDMDQARRRLALFGIGLCGLVMALSVTRAYEDRGLAFALAYWVARLILVVGLLDRSRIAFMPYTVSAFLTGPALVVGALLPASARLAVWTAAAALDLAMPTLRRRRLSALHFDADHLTERYGLFVLIALGESIVAIGLPVASSDNLSWLDLLAVAVSFCLVVGLWWVYFHLAVGAMRYALATAPVQFTVTRHVLSYAHLSFVWAIILVAVGMAETVAHPAEPMGLMVGGLLVGGCALFLATFGYTRWTMFHLVSRTRLTAAAVVLVVFPLSGVLPALVTEALLALIVVALNLWELRATHQAGRVVPR